MYIPLKMATNYTASFMWSTDYKTKPPFLIWPLST